MIKDTLQSFDFPGLLKLRETNKSNKELVDEIIHEKHEQIFGKSGASKPLRLKIKDISLGLIIKKLSVPSSNYRNELKNDESVGFKYGFPLLNATQIPYDNPMFIFSTECLYTQDRSFTLRDLEILIAQKNKLKSMFPDLKSDADNAFYHLIKQVVQLELDGSKDVDLAQYTDIIDALQHIDLDFDLTEYAATDKLNNQKLIKRFMKNVGVFKAYGCNNMVGFRKSNLIEKYFVKNPRYLTYVGDWGLQATPDEMNEYRKRYLGDRYIEANYREIDVDSRLTEDEKDLFKEYIEYRRKLV